MPGKSQRIKSSINRLVEPHKVQRRKRGKTPANRPGIPGRLGAAARATPVTPP